MRAPDANGIERRSVDARSRRGRRPSGARTIATREIASLVAADASVAAQPSFGDLPVLVIAAGTPSAGESEARRRAWRALQEDLVTVSEDARLRVIEGSDHLGLLHRDEHALEVARGIATVVTGARDGRTTRRFLP